MDKRLFFILVLSIPSLTNCCGLYTTAGLKKTAVQRALLKEYFLCVCITEGFKDQQIGENDISQAVYFDILRYSQRHFKSLKITQKRLLKP